MAAIYAKPKLASSFIGLESTFGTTPTMTRMYPIAGTMTWELVQKEVENEDERVNKWDYLDPVRGTQDGTLKFDYAIRPNSAQLNTTTAPTTTHPLSQLCYAVFGGRQTNTGSNVGAGATTGSVPVDASSRFAIGQWALFPLASGLEPGRITNISASSLIVFPALSAAPVSGSACVNMDNFFPSETDTNSLTIQHAKADDTNLQWTFNGCVGDIEIKSERNDIVKLSANLKVASWVTGSQSISTAVVADSMASPMVCKGATTILQAITNGTRTHYPIESFAVKCNFDNDFVPELGGVEGKTQAFRVGGTRMFCEATVKFTADIAQADANWYNQTKLQFTVMVPVGSGTSKRWIVIDMPTCVPVNKPKSEDTNGRWTHTVTLRGKINQIISSPSTDLARSPFILAFG